MKEIKLAQDFEATTKDEPNTFSAEVQSDSEAPDLAVFLSDPDQLQAMLHNPAELAGDSELTADKSEALNALRTEVITQIVAPEGAVHVSREIREQLRSDAAEIVDHQVRAVDEISEGISRARRASRSFEDNITQAKRTLRMIEDALHQRDPSAIQEIAGRAGRNLNGFVEDYSRYSRLARGVYQEGDISTRARALSVSGDEIHTVARQALSELSGLPEQIENAPESLYRDNVESEVAERGASTVDEHQQWCIAEVEQTTKSTDRMVGASRDFVGGGEDLLRAIRMGSDAVDSLPVARRLSDSITEVISTMRRVAEGQMRPQMLQGLIEDLQRTIGRVGRGVGDINDASMRASRKLDIVRSQIDMLRS